MGDNNSTNSKVDITIGPNEIYLEGSEDFVSEELSAILDKLDLHDQSGPMPVVDQETKQASLTDSVDTEVNYQEKSGGGEILEQESGLDKAAENIGVDSSRLKHLFFVDEDELHIENPLNIPPKHALLGYCTIENERKGRMTFENQKMKEKFVSKEGVEIDAWGDFIYKARKRGDIRDDPNSDQNRNKPFRLTRSGRESFIEWLTEGHEDS